MAAALRFALMLVAITASVAGADEPRAAFVLKDGWVELALKQDGKPIADAAVQIIDEKGTPFGEGETGATGQASFPAPRGTSFTLEIKSAGRTSDPIRLHMMEQRLEPARVLLSYGLRPCCRFKSQSDEPTPEAPTEAAAEAVPIQTPYLYRVLLVGMIVWLPWLAVAFLVRKYRRSRDETSITKE